MTAQTTPRPGALVISLDFELLWGVRDRPDATRNYGPHLMGARTVIPRILDLFEEFEIACTWATVGFLFAGSRADLESLHPILRPRYVDSSLDPYREPVGENEADDPLHFAPSLIDLIRSTPRQELGTHTYSHYYCGEAGQDREAFRDDLESALRAAQGSGDDVRSIVFPRNQHNPAYDSVLEELGVRAYRGNPQSYLWTFSDGEAGRSFLRRAGRLMDRYVGVDHGLIEWSDVPQNGGLSNVRASCFLAPYSPALRHLEPVRRTRLRQRIRAAARSRALVHIWWHPHNFGVHQDENLGFLRSVLGEYQRCREEFGMRSLSMGDVDRCLRQTPSGVIPPDALDP